MLKYQSNRTIVATTNIYSQNMKYIADNILPKFFSLYHLHKYRTILKNATIYHIVIAIVSHSQ